MRTTLPAVMLALATAVLVSTAVTACGQATTGDAGPAGRAGQGDEAGAELRDRTFVSTAVTEAGRPRPLAPGTRVSLRFTGDGRLLADAGCNTMSGIASIGGGRLEVADLATTELGCDPPRHEQDAWLAALLGARPSWRLDGDTLVLASGGTELRLSDREVAEPDAALEGTTWLVDTIVDAQAAASAPAGSSASVVFEAGSAAVATGCNTGSASYQVAGATITFGQLALTRKACPPDLAPLEDAVRGVLDGAVQFEIDADRLTVTHPSGRGLQLRAQR